MYIGALCVWGGGDNEMGGVGGEWEPARLRGWMLVMMDDGLAAGRKLAEAGAVNGFGVEGGGWGVTVGGRREDSTRERGIG